jgi:hypothetical protein
LIDPVLDKQRDEVRQLVGLWEEFCRLIDGARASKQAGSAEKERFEQVRNRIAEMYPSLMARLELSIVQDDGVLQVLERVASFEGAGRLSTMHWQKVEEARGRSDVELRGILGLLEARRRQMEPVREGLLLLQRVLNCPFFKLLLAIASIVIFFLVLGYFI